jgi:TonB family protein
MRVVPPHAEAHGGGPVEPSSPAAREPGGIGDGPAPAVAGPEDRLAKPAAPDPTPQPTPTPLSCTRPDIPPATIRAVAPETPALAVQQGITGTVVVVVSLDAQSRIVATRIASSPSAVLNGAALAATRGSQFRTEVKNCAPRAADYTFSVEFTAE